MDKNIQEILGNSIKEFETFFKTDTEGTIKLSRMWIGGYCSGITVPNTISTKDELILHTKGLALWFSMGTNEEASNIIGSMVKIIDNKTNPNMEGLKHYVGAFEKNKMEINENDLIRILFIVCRIKSQFGAYGGAVTMEGLLVDNITYNFLFIQKITTLSIYCGVNYGVLFDCLVWISFLEIHTYSFIDMEKIEIAEQQKINIQDMLNQHSKSTPEETYESILQTVNKNFKKIIEIKQKSSTYAKVDFPELSQEVLENSYDAVKDSLKTDNVQKLPLDQYRIDFQDVLEDVQEEERAFDNLFTNPKRVGQLEAGNHFMSHILKDTLMMKDDKVVYKNHTEALLIGYTQKAVTMSLDKETTLRELKSSLKILEKYPSEDSEKLILFTTTMIEIMKQKKYVNMIPFKTISKKSGITKNEAKRYAKEFANKFTIRDTTFDNNFDDLKIHDFTNKNT